jgi:methyltransferase-like protein
LHALSILDIPSDWSPFDYILCHGVFSWVPAQVQEKILEICSTMLSPDGIAYISYNALPGWHLRGIVRDMMLYHAMRFDSAERRIQEAKLILDFIAQHAVGSNAVAYSMFLKSEAEILRKLPDHYLYHEHLEDHCEPFYFHEFVERARRLDLEYLAEATLGSMAPSNFGPVAERALSAIATNLIELEQFMDFLGNRTFRETLLRHTGRAVATYTIGPQSLSGLYITGKCRPQTQAVDLRPQKPITFESTQNKRPITTSNPLVKAALLCLANEFPGSILFDSLVERARQQLSKVNVDAADSKPAAQQLGEALLQLLTTSSLLEVSSLPAIFTTTPGPKPLASPLARLQAETSTSVVTLRHDSATLGESESAVLKLLDGTRAAGEIAAILGQPEAEIGGMIDRLAKCALLLG